MTASPRAVGPILFALIGVGCVLFGLRSAEVRAAAARPLTAEERAAATKTTAGAFSADAEQSFRFELPAPDGPTDLLCGELDAQPAFALLRGDRVLAMAPMTDGQRLSLYGGCSGVSMADLNNDGKLDVIVTANVCAGANCVANNFTLAAVLLASPSGYRQAKAWTTAVPYSVVEGGIRSIRTYAKSRPVTLSAAEAKAAGN
jgi:hypothetical protein